MRLPVGSQGQQICLFFFMLAIGICFTSVGAHYLGTKCERDIPVWLIVLGATHIVGAVTLLQQLAFGGNILLGECCLRVSFHSVLLLPVSPYAFSCPHGWSLPPIFPLFIVVDMRMDGMTAGQVLYAIYQVLLGLFGVGWFIVGMVWVYGIDYDNHYCEEALFLWGFSVVTMLLVVLGLVLLCVICFVCINTCIGGPQRREDRSA